MKKWENRKSLMIMCLCFVLVATLCIGTTFTFIVKADGATDNATGNTTENVD